KKDLANASLDIHLNSRLLYLKYLQVLCFRRQSATPAITFGITGSVPALSGRQSKSPGSARKFFQSTVFAKCVQQPDVILLQELQARCLPPDLRGDRKTSRLVNV